MWTGRIERRDRVPGRLTSEAIPTLAEIPGQPSREYARTVLRRLANTRVRDQIARLCIDGTPKFPSFLIPTVETQLERNGPIGCAALALAARARYLATVPEALRAPDSYGELAAVLAERSLAQPSTFLALEDVFTKPLARDERFRDALTAAAEDLATLGPLDAIETVLLT